MVFFFCISQLVLTYLAFFLHSHFSSEVTEVTQQVETYVDHDQAFVWGTV